METEMMGGTMPPDTSQQEAEARSVASQLIKKHGDIIVASADFNEQSQNRLSMGAAPNELFPRVAGIFTQIAPLAESNEKIESAKSVVKNDILNNLIYDNTMMINTMLQESVLELPEIENLSMEDEVTEYEQALIQLYNTVPNVRDDKKREDLFFTADLLNQAIEKAKNRDVMS